MPVVGNFPQGLQYLVEVQVPQARGQTVGVGQVNISDPLAVANQALPQTVILNIHVEYVGVKAAVYPPGFLQ